MIFFRRTVEVASQVLRALSKGRVLRLPPTGKHGEMRLWMDRKNYMIYKEEGGDIVPINSMTIEYFLDVCSVMDNETVISLSSAAILREEPEDEEFDG